MMMVIYLASLARSILALHKLIDNKVWHGSRIWFPMRPVTRQCFADGWSVVELHERMHTLHSSPSYMHGCLTPDDNQKLIEQNSILHETSDTAVFCW